ncbi:MAG: PASTA domain-containing protein [Bacillati bacterium ANGP1]|uniref:PASTA domain-containing protein n=1 Tax=Candidatus Segetimicrobium genomatis TaxID=2569760 RepID=A0A537LM27_9BACT|nr:MAG: PASTA domain-containing protein [Terrabacteria group bacterium ANGP1]
MPPEEPTLPAPAAPPPLRGDPPIRPAPRMGWGPAGRGRRMWIAVAAIAAASLVPAAVAERRAWLGAHPRVPNLIGKSLAEAGPLVVPLHFGLIVNGTRPDPAAPPGTILAQNPPAGRRVLARSIIQLKVSQGSGVVPLLRGAPVHEAAERLEAIGLRLGRVHYIEDDAQAGTVLEQFTPPGWQLGANDSVDVLVSQGPTVGAAGPGPEAGPSPPAIAVPSTRIHSG